MSNGVVSGSIFQGFKGPSFVSGWEGWSRAQLEDIELNAWMAKRSKCQRSCDLVLSEDVDHLYTTWVVECDKVSDILEDVSDGCDQKRFV